jgi:hypothetical protein
VCKEKKKGEKERETDEMKEPRAGCCKQMKEKQGRRNEEARERIRKERENGNREKKQER